MIVRKPYAFLIKYFKIIHIILFILMGYLLFKVRNIYIFFKNYVKTGTYSYVLNIANKYINIIMIITSILLVLMLLAIFFLMRQKKKPVFYYIFSSIFYFVTFISFLILLSFYSNLEYISYSNQLLVLYRDLTMVLYYLNYYFIIIAFIRGFGFNVKKFNFEKDIKELDITDADREEIEINSSIDYDKVNNYIRRKKRNFKYYIKENSFILTIFLVILVISFTAYFSVSKLVINKIYTEKEIVSVNNLDFSINSSYITNVDYNNDYIKDSSTYYLIIDFNILNKNEESKELDIKNYRVKINDKYYYPKNNLNNKFNDIGIIYKKQKLLKDINNNYIIVFELDNFSKNNIDFELYYSKNKDEYAYKKIVLDPFYDQELNIGTYKLMEKVNLDKTYIKNGTFNLNDYSFHDMIEYKYTKCDNMINNGMCNDYNATVVPKMGDKILKIEYNTNLNKNIFNYLNIKYIKDNKDFTIKNSSIKDITPDNYLENNVLLSVPSNLVGISDFDFYFDIRGVSFTYSSVKD